MRLYGYVLALVVVCAGAASAQTKDWLPVTPVDLNYTDKTGAPAVILYTEDFTDAPMENGGGRIELSYVFSRYYYYRIKVLTDEGKDQANIEIPYWHGYWRIEDLHARVIQPDGSTHEFDGKVYDKTVVKNRGVKLAVRTFSLPDVKIGSIIEYRYVVRWKDYIEDTAWDLQGPLAIKKAHYVLRPYTGYANVPLRLSWIGINLPPGVQPTRQPGNLWTLDLTDTPPVPEEQYAPPREWSHMTMRFIYSSDPDANLAEDAFWQKKAKWWGDWAEKFMSKHKAVDAEAARLVSPGDSPEAKLRKLYARAQQVRNLSFERSKTEKELKQQDIKEPETVDELLQKGYGRDYHIEQFFIALARAAGFEANYAVVAPRNEHVFFKNILNTNQFRDHVAVVKVNGQSVFLDPGTRFLPYGMLWWGDTDVPVLVTTKAGGEFLSTPAPRPEDAVIERTAALHVADGNLEGTMKLSFRGAESVLWRIDERNNDETGRRKDLESALSKLLPAGAKVELTSVGSFDSNEDPLVAEFKVSIPNAITQTGKRVLLPAGLFESNDTHPFRYAYRRLPVYFAFPFQEVDDITIDLPEGYRLEGAPQPRNQKSWVGAYDRNGAVEGSKLHLHRQLQLSEYMILAQHYSTLRGFYDYVRAGDDESLVLSKTGQ